MEKHKTCCVTGHRPGGFPWNYHDKNCSEQKAYLKAMHDLIEKLVSREGYDYFICGGAIGVDTDFAETVLALKEKYPHIQLEIAVPCENQDLKWSDADKAKHREVLDRADVVTVLSKHYTRFCMQRRNQYMVDKSDYAIAFWNSKTKKGGTYNTIKYIERKLPDYELVCLDEFTEENRQFEEFMDRLLDSCTPSQEERDAAIERLMERGQDRLDHHQVRQPLCQEPR